ncbi:hypothetical protein CK203_021779 [Vitis vinifera]|uniref:Uncharacterized protein n=1 Tax=Vitis vinifera TaxID=29760 RepID=A0A438J4K1_VITVI|nr:hypothetical protein CK203_021779 [Vitis vinifera]
MAPEYSKRGCLTEEQQHQLLAKAGVQGSISVDGPRMDSSVSFNSREDSRILDQASFLPGLEHGREFLSLLPSPLLLQIASIEQTV